MARKLALEVLIEYDTNQSYLNLLLNHRLTDSKLSRKDKDLATHIIYGCVTYKLYLDYLLQPYMKDRRVKKYDYWILMCACYQYVFLKKIPVYAIINESVSLAKNKVNAKFINAVLHSLTENPLRSTDDLDPYEKLSVETSHPLWLVKMLSKQYDFDTTVKVCLENNKIALHSARVNTLKISKEKLMEIEPTITSGNLAKDAVIFAKGNIAKTSYYAEGFVTVQDEASQYVAEFLDPDKNSRVLDMCSAPGSKTCHLAAIMDNTGEIDAFDIYDHKIDLINKNCHRLGVHNVRAQNYDATKLDELYDEGTFDSILLDGPCSGLGVMKRKPEIKYHDSNVMDELIPLQAELLENAYYLLKKSGKMVYSTCTINKKENEYQIESFIKKHPDMKVVEQKTILPYEYQSDGFYMCKLIKESKDETDL